MFEKLLYKYAHLYETYKKVSDVFVEPNINFSSCAWRHSCGLPVYRRGPIISFAKDRDEYIKTPGKYGNWAKYTHWDPKFLESKSAWGRLWRKVIRPHYQLPIWMAFHVYDWGEWVKRKEDHFSYEYGPQFTIVVFGWSFNWVLSAPSASTDFASLTTGIKYPDNDAYWESIYDYLYEDGDDRMSNAIDTICYTSKDGVRRAWFRCRPEYIKPEYLDEYHKKVEEKKSKGYEGYEWV